MVVAGAAALAVVGAGVGYGYGYSALDRAVTLSVDGQTTALQTRARTVADLLASRGLTVGPHDQLRPAPATPLAEGSAVTLQFGRLVTFTVDGQAEAVWTTALDVDDALRALPVDTAGAEISAGPGTAIGRQGLAVEVSTRKTVTITAAGHHRVVHTTARTVGQALADAKIKTDRDDHVSSPPSTPVRNGSHVHYTKVTVRIVSVSRSIPHRTVRRSAATLAQGATKIQTPGVDGRRVLTFRVVRYDGKPHSRRQVGAKVVRRPVTEVLLVGTKKPAPAASGGGNGVWQKIARCESGGNWSINTGNGYYGGLQFNLPTWHAYGGGGRPDHASRARQIAVAKRVQRAQGWGAWSGCSAKLGLR